MIDIYILTIDGEAPRPLTIDEEATVEELLRMAFPEDHAERFLVVGDENERRERHHKLRECGVKHGHHVHCHPREIHYSVDKEPKETTHHKMTAYQIMDKAGVDPEKHYLIRLKRDHEKESYKDDPKKEIHLHNCMEFITASLGPTPVS
jgi:hypothetical protein